MLRLRMAFLALASGSLLTLSGCCSFCDGGTMFPRLFGRTSGYGSIGHVGSECGCQSGFMPPPPEMMMSQGPLLTAPSTASATTMPTITTVPASQPPLFKTPAAPTPYFPSH